MKINTLATKVFHRDAPAAHKGDGAPEVDFPTKYPLDEPLRSLDAADMRALFRAGYNWLAHHADLVNRMNVFPVPDGDTGTNLLLTIKSAWAAIQVAPAAGAGIVVAAAAEGAHHGSRGNSGVIFGQMLHGMGQALATHDTLTAADLAAGLAQGSAAAYAGVPSPVEGTILTVTRAMRDAARGAGAEDDIRALLRAVVIAADATVRQTPDLLPVLKQAGVVDSGAKGLYFIFDGMARALMGEDVAAVDEVYLAPTVGEDHARQVQKGHRALPPVVWGFDVQFLVERPNKPLETILADISAMGEYPLVEGDEHLVKIHVHVFDPAMPLGYGVELGFMTDVVVENMDDMAASARIGRAGALLTEVYSLAIDEYESDTVGIVAVAPGEGFRAIFHSLGAHAVVCGGQTMNPSVADLAAAIRAVPGREIVLLPNNRNILLAATEAGKLIHKEERKRTVAIVASKTLPEGIAAMLAFDPRGRDAAATATAMIAELAHVRSGTVTQAVRDATVDGFELHAGDVIGLQGDRVAVRGTHVDGVVLELLSHLVDDTVAVVTLYYGDFVAEHAAENLAEQVRAGYPELDVELAYGGQPHYFYILSAE